MKNAVAMGAQVTVNTRTDKKKADARALGAVDVIASAEDGALQKHASRFDFVIDPAVDAAGYGPSSGCEPPASTALPIGW